MSIKGYATAYETRKYDRVPLYNKWVKPTANGTWGVSEVAVRCTSSFSGASTCYKAFDSTNTSLIDRIKPNECIEWYSLNPVSFDSVSVVSRNGYLAGTADLYYADSDGGEFVKCGSYDDTSNSKQADFVLDADIGRHPIWRIVFTSRPKAKPTSNADFNQIQLGVTEYFAGWGDKAIDEYLPEGMAGWSDLYTTYMAHGGVDTKLEGVYVTWKDDSKVDLFEGRDDVPTITGSTDGYVTYKPHDGVDVTDIQAYGLYRPHQGVDIDDVQFYATERDDSKVDSFVIPYGIGGYVDAYITYMMNLLAGYLNDLTIEKVAGIVIENVYIPLKDVRTINNIIIENDNTADSTGGEI